MLYLYYNTFVLILIHGGIKLNKIQLDNDTQVSVVWYKNVSSKSFKNFYTPKWSELVNLLSDPVVSSDKYFRGSVVYGDISNGVDDEGIEYEKYRNDNNVIYRDVICLDYDDEDDLNKLHKSIKSELEGFSWFWHTTFRHTNESPRIRLYVPLSERVSANEYRAYVKAIAQKLHARLTKGVMNHLELWCYLLSRQKNILLSINIVTLQF